MKGKKLRIGLIFNHPLSYSETFILDKIAILKSLGYKVLVFSGYPQNQNSNYPQIYGLPKKIYKTSDLLFTIKGLLKLFVGGIPSVFRYFFYEKKNGTSLIAVLKSVYLNAHILPYNLDFIHFGFSHVAVGRELLGKAMNAKVSVSMRGYDICIYPLLNPGCYSKLIKYVDKIHCVSFDLMNKAIECGFSEDKISVIYQTLDLENLTNKNTHRKINDPVKIISVGRLHWKKGFDYALLAMKQLYDNGINFRYKIIGSGDLWDRITYAINQLGLSDNVELLGEKTHKEVIELMEDSDIYIQSSVQEGFCTSILEAQAVGLLAISSNAEGLQENIEDGKSGWIVEKRNAEALYNKINEVIHLPAVEKHTISSYARKRIEEKFSLYNYNNEWKDFFSKN